MTPTLRAVARADVELTPGPFASTSGAIASSTISWSSSIGVAAQFRMVLATLLAVGGAVVAAIRL
jgi:hypothetical protein